MEAAQGPAGGKDAKKGTKK